MLTRLRLKNIKTWASQLWEPGVELAPISLFLGPNSAGKTTILQMPLLLKQTFESPDRNLDLNLGGQPSDLVDLGHYESVVHNHESKRGLGVGVSLRVSRSRRIHYTASFSSRDGTPRIEHLEICAARAKESRCFSADRQQKGGYLLEGPDYAPKMVGQRLNAKRSFRPERAVAFSADAIAEFGLAGAEIQDLSLSLRQAMSRVVYLGPLRERPERTYLWSGVEPGELGKRGEYSVHALLASDNSTKRQKENEEGGHQWLVERVSEWLRKLGVADELVLERQGRSRHYELIVVRGGQRANLVDVGFGISQVLPMLVLAHVVPRGTTIVAEQPEIHLHPRAQGGLAELMAHVAKTRNVQFIVETHSEHLFRRLQTLVADERVKPEECALYFVDRDEAGSSELRRLELNEFGKIANWPKQFFGDAIGETERQTRRMIERMAQTSARGSR